MFALAACAALWLSGCAAPLGPGYLIERQEVRVDFSPQPQPAIRITAEYRLQNTGNQPLDSLDVRLPGRRFRPLSMRALWDAVPIATNVSPDNVRDTELRFSQLWKVGETHALKLSYEIPSASVGDESLGYRAAETAELLDTTETSVNSLLRRARAAFDTRLPAVGRERAPLPDSVEERELVGLFTEAVEIGDVDGIVALLTEDAWLTMPPLPHAYQGAAAIGAFLRGAAERRGAPLRVVATRANSQPAFGCYLTAPEADAGRAFAMFVLSLEGGRISEITWFAGSGVFPRFGLPRFLR